MSFLGPLALLGLLTVPAILLLHLLRQRREPMAISSLLFWRGLEQKREGGLPRRLPLTLMLLLQLLAAIALTLGLARPALSFLLDQPRQTIFILDMTTSMTAVDVPSADPLDDPVRRFDAARQLIEAHVQAMDDDDSFAVVSLGPRPQILLTGDGQQKTQALLVLDNLVAGATGADLPAALTLVNGLVDADRPSQIFVLTDSNTVEHVEPQLLPAMLAPVDWQVIPNPSPSSADKSNQALLNVSTRRLPDGRHRIFARIVNYGDQRVIRTLRLFGDDVVTHEDLVEIEPEASVAKVWTLSAQTETAVLEIVEPDLLLLDNRTELLLQGTVRHRVLLLSETPDALARALEIQPGVELTVSPLNLAPHDFADFDLVVFDGLPLDLTAWPRGNLLVVDPPLGHPLLPADNFARNLRPDLATASASLAGIDLSGVYFARVTRLAVPSWAEVDLMAAGGETEPALPLIFHGSVDNSRVIVWSFDLAASNLPARLALPLLVANTLSTLLAPSPPAVVPLGEPVLLARNLSIEVPDGHRLFLSASEATGSANLFAHTKQPGLYRIYNENNAFIAGFAVHAGSPLESDLTRDPQQSDPDPLPLLDASAPAPPEPETAYQEFWPWLAGLALVVVTFEGWLAWRR